MIPFHRHTLPALNFLAPPTDDISTMIMLENYENMPTGNINYNNFSTLSGSSNRAAVDDDNGNQVLRFFPTNNHTHRFFGHPDGQRIEPDQPFTLYFKFLINKISSRVNTQLRIQDSSTFRVKFDTDFANPFILWYDNPTHIGGEPPVLPDQQVDENTWYEVWIHLKAEQFSHPDTSTASRYEAYIRGGAFSNPTRITIDDDDPDKYLYNNKGTISDMHLIGWSDTDHILHDDFYISLGDEIDLSTPDNRLWFDRSQGFAEWNFTDGAWKGSKNTFEDDDAVGFIFGPVTITEDVRPSSIIIGFDTTFKNADNYPLSGDLKILNGRMLFDLTDIQDFGFSSVYIGPTGIFHYDDAGASDPSPAGNYNIGTGVVTLDGGTIRWQMRNSFQYRIQNDFEITANGGNLDCGRRSGNPETIFDGKITLRGNLLCRAEADNGEQVSLRGPIVLDAPNITIRGQEFSAGTAFGIRGDITEEQQVNLTFFQDDHHGSFSIYSDVDISGNVTLAGNNPSNIDAIRMFLQTGCKLRGNVNITTAGSVYISGTDVFDSGAVVAIDPAIYEFVLNESITVSGFSYDGTSLSSGTYTAAQLETEFGTTGVFTGTGEVTVL